MVDRPLVEFLRVFDHKNNTVGFKVPKAQEQKLANITLLCKCDVSLKTDRFKQKTICHQSNFNLLKKSFFF